MCPQLCISLSVSLFFLDVCVCQDATFALYLLSQEKSASYKQTKQDKWASESHKATSCVCCQSSLFPLHHFLDSWWLHLQRFDKQVSVFCFFQDVNYSTLLTLFQRLICGNTNPPCIPVFLQTQLCQSSHWNSSEQQARQWKQSVNTKTNFFGGFF